MHQKHPPAKIAVAVLVGATLVAVVGVDVAIGVDVFAEAGVTASQPITKTMEEAARKCFGCMFM
jgi:tetrahydrodipicolinate N-succinyltransferase